MPFIESENFLAQTVENMKEIEKRKKEVEKLRMLSIKRAKENLRKKVEFSKKKFLENLKR